MEIQRLKADLDRENIHPKGKVCAVRPSKRHGLAVRGALGEINLNVRAPCDLNIGKLNNGSTVIEKKPNRNAVKSCNYSHVTSKVDTGITNATKTKLSSSRVPLRREESTATLAVKAAIQTRAILKDVQNDSQRIKDLHNMPTRNKVDDSKINKLPVLKETSKTSKKVTKQVNKDAAEILNKLKLSELKTELKEDRKHTPDVKLSLPDDIEDIDAEDGNSPMLMSIYTKDIYKYLRELEEKYPIQYDHLRKQLVITERMRKTLLDWLVDVHLQFAMILETFQLTVGIIDRYLQIVRDVPREQLQLIGVTAMFIASKYEEIYPPGVGDFVYITDNAYSKTDVFKCEVEMLRKLEFCVARPIPLSFSRRFVKAAKGTSKNHHLAKYFVDLSLLEYSMAHYRPSEMAAAAICLSLYVLSSRTLKEIWTPTLSYYSGYSLKQIDPIIRKIAKIVIDADTSKHKAVYKKYSSPHLAKVATLPQLKGLAINELANTPTKS